MAKKFHNPDVSQLLESISSRQYAVWLIDYKLNPWGEHRADLRQAITSNLIAAQYGGKSKISDFMPYKIETNKEQTAEEQKGVCKTICAMQKAQGDK